MLSDEILTALAEGKISEGHTRPLLMLIDRPEEQMVLFREIILKKMTVREAEKISRKIAFEKVRKHDRLFSPDIVEMEQQASDSLGTRVHIEPKEVGGKIQIDYFNEEDLRKILSVLNKEVSEVPAEIIASAPIDKEKQFEESVEEVVTLTDDRGEEEKKKDEEESYSLDDFVV
jgi:ParB-like chromosome segregation protein Spo0J